MFFIVRVGYIVYTTCWRNYEAPERTSWCDLVIYPDALINCPDELINSPDDLLIRPDNLLICPDALSPVHTSENVAKNRDIVAETGDIVAELPVSATMSIEISSLRQCRNKFEHVQFGATLSHERATNCCRVSVYLFTAMS